MIEAKIANALIQEVEHSGPSETVDKIKNQTALELRELDPTSTIHFTEYFNHSYAPDMVIRWPQEGQDERFVYLRMSNNEAELRHDISKISDRKPMVVTLISPENARGKTPRRTLDEVATEAETLVSSLDGLDALGSSRANDTIAGLLSSTVARGGRGVVTEYTAHSALKTVGAGFKGAQELDPGPVEEATATADHLLRPEFAGRVNRFLQAIWIGAGGRPDQYPGQLELGGDLDDNSWNYLLGLEDIDDLAFWRRIGRSLGLKQVIRLDAPNPNNFHNLVKANCETLWARACQVVDAPESLFDDAGDKGGVSWRWMIDRSALALVGPSFTAYLAETKDELPRIQIDDTDGIDIPKLRARSGHVSITKVVGRVGQEEFDLAGVQQQDVIMSGVLDLLTKVPNGALKVVRATARAQSGHNINLDFTHSCATAVKKAKPPLVLITTCTLPLLREIDNEQVIELARAFAGTDGIEEPDLMSILESESESKEDRPQIDGSSRSS